MKRRVVIENSYTFVFNRTYRDNLIGIEDDYSTYNSNDETVSSLEDGDTLYGGNSSDEFTDTAIGGDAFTYEWSGLIDGGNTYSFSEE